jgi:trans-L-3-hydroxyproline dehydratase
MHTGGEPLRVITSGYPQIEAKSLLAYRRILKNEHDHLRTALMHEPRGHADMYGCLVLPPFDEQADCSVIFLHNEGYSTMCGHAVIAIMTLAMQMGWVDVIDGKATMIIEAPCGLIQAYGETLNGKITAKFDCVPSFAVALNEKVYVDSLQQTLSYDLAYGGAFYAYVDARQMDLDLTPANNRQLIDLGREIKAAVIATSNKIKHPLEYDLSFLYGVIFVGCAHNSHSDSRNVCVFADGEVDRSPTGSGVSGRMALHFAKGELQIGQSMTIESILGSTFVGQVKSAERYSHYEAVIPSVSGDAFVCGQNTFIIQADDALRHGFLLG